MTIDELVVELKTYLKIKNTDIDNDGILTQAAQMASGYIVANYSYYILSAVVVKEFFAIDSRAKYYLDAGRATLVTTFVNDVEEIPQGSYFYNRGRNVLELLNEGDFRRKATQLGLGQELPGDASVDVFFLADLTNILDEFGNRGYRAAQLEAGIIGGKLYLAAYGLGLGASGLTFFDDDVTRFFSPHAQGKSTMFLVALGKSE